MAQIKILGISLRNFKGFAELNISFDGQNTVILSGQNGYGKTTLFDALELLFTGKIKRMESYTEFHDSRNSVEQGILPLVYKRECSNSVMVQAVLLVDGKKFTVFREAKVSDMTNPVNFSAFSGLRQMDADGKKRDFTEEELKEYGLTDLEEQYDFLNYLSQEEATAFLKRKEADRAKDISELFNLQTYDIPLEKIKKIASSLKSKKDVINGRLSDLNKQIDTLGKVADSHKSEVAYHRICAEPQYWDAEEPELSYEQYYSLLSENGLMDRLLYYVRNNSTYRQYSLNRFINGIITNGSGLSSIAFWMKYSDYRSLFQQFKEFKERLETPVLNLKIDTLNGFELVFPEALLPYIENADIEKFAYLRNNLVRLYNSSTAIQKEISRLFSERQTIAQHIIAKAGILLSPDCPLCGNRFDSNELLIHNIRSYDDVFKQQFAENNKALQQQFEVLMEFIQEHFIKPIRTRFDNLDITPALYEAFSHIDLPYAEKQLLIIEHRLNISISRELPVQEIEVELTKQLEALRTHLHDDIDYNALDETYQIAARFISKKHLIIEEINNKKSYLQMIWSKKSSGELQTLQNEKERVSKRNVAINRLQEKLKQLKSDIEQQKQAYFSRLLSDIKILFYIYSGRIMQTCYFGRGLFIKPDDKCKHIIFTSGNYDGNDVDALYNMSSGQLVTLVISLLLSLNKLYGTFPVIAIDDPVQTIDDINLWGLIETLRHDFDDHFMILSTHERDYRDLLEYKFKKWNIATKVVDMASVESTR